LGQRFVLGGLDATGVPGRIRELSREHSQDILLEIDACRLQLKGGTLAQLVTIGEARGDLVEQVPQHPQVERRVGVNLLGMQFGRFKTDVVARREDLSAQRTSRLQVHPQMPVAEKLTTGHPGTQNHEAHGGEQGDGVRGRHLRQGSPLQQALQIHVAQHGFAASKMAQGCLETCLVAQ